MRRMRQWAAREKREMKWKWWSGCVGMGGGMGVVDGESIVMEMVSRMRDAGARRVSVTVDGV